MQRLAACRHVVEAAGGHYPMKVTGVSYAGGCWRAGCYPRVGLPEVAFAGRSNSGKSSAINCLCGRRKLACVGKNTGRTGAGRAEALERIMCCIQAGAAREDTPCQR